MKKIIKSIITGALLAGFVLSSFSCALKKDPIKQYSNALEELGYKELSADEEYDGGNHLFDYCKDGYYIVGDDESEENYSSFIAIVPPSANHTYPFEEDDVKSYLYGDRYIVGDHSASGVITVGVVELYDEKDAESAYKQSVKNIKRIIHEPVNSKDVEYETEKGDNTFSIVKTEKNYNHACYIELRGKYLITIEYYSSRGDEKDHKLYKDYRAICEAVGVECPLDLI